MSTSGKFPALCFHAISLHNQGITGKHITIAVLDSGISKHPDIAPSRILAFEDFTHSTPYKTSYYDDFSHGTHVTGIIASSRIGIAPHCNLICLKVLDQHGNTSSEQLIEALKWLLLHKSKYNIQIVNISIGGKDEESKNEKNPLNEWVNKLWESGFTVCCSAGNNGPKPDSITTPGNCKKIITVGSSDGKYYSSAGPLLPYITKPEVVAPGSHIISLKPGGGYHIKSGTSMAVPFISGACALLLQREPSLTNNQIKIRLMHAAHTVPYLPYNMQGAGLVSLKHLVS